MRLARRALVAALTTLLVCMVASAQTLRPQNDPRNTAPTVGTGGPVGGPTGLFTIYDGQTLRRGEFTLSIAYSNWDRDPGNVDLTEYPLSVQVGLSDGLEVFFNTDIHRAIHPNNPANLSSFYLPNAPYSNRAAIVFPPNTAVARLGTPFFRPTTTGTGAAFPFVGSSFGTNFGGRIPDATLGARAVTGGGNFFTRYYQGADQFPGIGSPYGSILPGVVLATSTSTVPVTGPGVPPTGVATTQIPTTYFTRPSYLPDAPFIAATYGETKFNTFTFGAKWRMTEPDNAFGFGLIPFYRYYRHKASDAEGFNEMQLGGGPGASFGDLGLVAFLDGRLARSVNLSANFGYILNGNPKSEAFGSSDVVLLDRPDEFLSGIGFDFPINRYFQPIAEFRTVTYVGGRTPNALENNPIDVLGGFRVFPTRYMGFSAAYRRHLNQQSRDNFDPPLSNAFVGSEDPHGAMFQFFVGRRNERAPEFLPNQPPTVSLSSDLTTVNICPTNASDPLNTSTQLKLTTSANDPDGDTLLYTYSVTGGRIVGEGANVTWDLSGVQPGSYKATVEVDDGCGCTAFAETNITVTGDCTPPPPTPTPCPNIAIDCPTDVVQRGTPVTFRASITGGGDATLTYNWTVSAGTITSGQGTDSITVDTSAVGADTTSIQATLDIGGVAPSCSTSATCTVSIAGIREPQKVDTYGNVAFDDEKARLDNFAIALQNEPGSQGYIIGYSGRTGRRGEGIARAERAKNYLVTSRGLEASRIITVDGGYREALEVELWLVPQGVTAPAATPTVDASQVRPARPARRGRATTRRAPARRAPARRR
jgi:hypothetical protein